MSQKSCQNCGAPIPAHALGGHCPRCLLLQGLDSDASGSPDVTLDRPALAGSVLDTIGATVGQVPRVLLRDTAIGEEPSPIVRPLKETDASLRYRIDGEIARGGMGSVLKGRDPDLGRDVAIKVLREDLRENPDLVRRFVEEAQIGGQLQHPGVVPIYELGTFADRRPFFSMKLVKGQTLADLLSARPAPSDDLPRFLSIYAAIAQTMAYAHTRGVIHRDLKPSNVMVGSFGEVQVMDWGLAKVLPRGGVVADAKAGKETPPETLIATARSGADTDLSHAGSILGTPSYMAPEQARGETDLIDERADVFALGSILCEVLTGHPAFTGRKSDEIVRKAARGETADALARLDGCGAESELASLAKDCLAGEPEERPHDANIVSERITAYLAGVQERLRAAEMARAAEAARAEEALRTAQVAEAKAKTERHARRLTVALAASLLGLVTLGGGGYAYWARQKADREATAVAAVGSALGRVEQARVQARQSPTADPQGWVTALAVVALAEDAAKGRDVPPALAARVSAARAGVERERDEAAAERRLLAELETLRAESVSGDTAWADVDRRFFEAFRDFGLDLDTLTPRKFGESLASRASAAELAGGLDAWAFHLHPSGEPSRARLLRVLEAARAADPDPWRDRLRVLWGQGFSDEVRAELGRLADDRRALQGREAAGLVLLGRVLQASGDRPRAQRVLRTAWFRAPGDFWLNYALGLAGPAPKDRNALFGRPEEALRYFMVATALRPDNAGARKYLSSALADLKDEGALDAAQERLRRNPVDFGAQISFSSASFMLGKQEELTAEAREAIRTRPDDAEAYLRLGILLNMQGKPEEALTAWREAVRLRPDSTVIDSHQAGILHRQGKLDEAAEAYTRAGKLAGLGDIRRQQGRLAEAEAAYRQAIRDDPNHPWAYIDLGVMLINQGRFDESIRVNRQLLSKVAGNLFGLVNLANGLRMRGDTGEAIATSREAIRLHPDSHHGYLGLAQALRQAGDFSGSLAALRKAHKLAKEDQGPAEPLAKLIPEAERAAALADRFPAVLACTDRPADNSERLTFAQMAHDTRRYGAAVRLWAEALESDPKLADDREAQHRYNAACSAALASDKGEDAPGDAGAKAALRARALGWLKGELAAWLKALESGDIKERPNVAATLRHWKQDVDLAAVRDPESLAKLSEAERKDWQAFWADVDAVLDPKSPTSE